MDLKFYPRTKLKLTSLRNFLVFVFVSVLSVGYTYAQTPATALAFNGLNNIITVPVSPTLNISSAITIESWIYVTKTNGVQDVISKSSSGVTNGYIFPRTTDGWRNLDFWLNFNGGGQQVLSVPYGTAKKNQWHHVAATYDGYYMLIYIDGVLAGTKAYTGTITVNNNPLAIGDQTGRNEYYGGKVDEVRIWNKALTQCNINNNMNCELGTGQTGLAAYYKFNQGFVNQLNLTETILLDASGNSNDGVLSTNFLLTGLLSNWSDGIVTGNCTAFTPVSATASSVNPYIAVGSDINLLATGPDGATYFWTGPNGFTSTQQNPTLTGVGLNASGTYTVKVTKNACSTSVSTAVTVALFGGALNFAGDDDVVIIPNSTSLNPASSISIETWIYPTNTLPTVQNVLSKSTRISSTGYIFPRTDDGWRSFSFWLDINGEWKVISAQFPGLNQWTHVAATYDGYYMKIYINGNLVGTLPVSGTVILNNNDLTIGQQDGTPEFYKGSVDETRIWSRALTQCEIQNNMNCQLSGDNNALASQTGLAAYYRYNTGLANVNNGNRYTTLSDSSGNGNNGTLNGFAFADTSSNWINGFVTATCTPFLGTQATAGNNGPNIEVGNTLQLHISLLQGRRYRNIL